MAGPKGRQGVPRKARDLLARLRANGYAPLPGYVGGQPFSNRRNKLPAGGRYLEFDVDPVSPTSALRGLERIVVDVTGGRAWYTPDHYQSFMPV